MKNTDNIEKLFKETFEHFEADVNPQLWHAIQSGISSVSEGAASVASKFAVGKIIAGMSSVAVIAGSAWYFSTSDNTIRPAPSNTSPPYGSFANPSVNEQNDISENKSDAILAETQTNRETNYFVHSLNNPTSDHSQQIQVVLGNSGNADTTNSSVSENTRNASMQAEQHRYGRSSSGPTSLIRGNQKQKSKSQENAASTGQDAEYPPNAAIEASAISGDAPLTVNFSNMGAASSLNWDFGDGTASRESSPSHTFKKPGTYTVKLIAKNSIGNASDEITIEVNAVSGIVNIPNVFSPNGDGENDFFFFGLKNIASMEVIISDVRGGFIRKWNNVNGNWDGKLTNGEDAPEGLYFYVLQATGTDGMTYSKKGSVTLSRKQE